MSIDWPDKSCCTVAPHTAAATDTTVTGIGFGTASDAGAHDHRLGDHEHDANSSPETAMAVCYYANRVQSHSRTRVCVQVEPDMNGRIWCDKRTR